MGAGRPSKYKKEYCKEIIPFMAAGESHVQFAAKIGVSKDTINEWKRQYPEFSAALNEGLMKCEAYWEKVMQAKTVTKTEGSNSLLVFYMKNRFKWTERVAQEVNQSTSITFTSDISDDGSITRGEE